jgi:hypothetical protein
MNWGKGIIIAMSSFVIFILTLVFTLMSNRVDLTSDDYYKKEIGFQDEIEAQRLGQNFDRKLIIQQSKNSIFFEFKDSLPAKIGTIEFNRPSDQKLDKTIVWKGEQMILSKNLFQKGLYYLTLEFVQGDQKIQIDRQIIIK